MHECVTYRGSAVADERLAQLGDVGWESQDRGGDELVPWRSPFTSLVDGVGEFVEAMTERKRHVDGKSAARLTAKPASWVGVGVVRHL